MSNEPLTKENILDAAEQVLRRYGPEKTSVVDVAKALQVSHGTLYRHFPSKAALREAVTERWLQRIAQPLREIADQSEGPWTDRLRLWLDTLIRAKRAYAREEPEMFAMYTAVTLEAVEMIRTHVNELIHQIAHMVEGGMGAGTFKFGEPEVIAKAILTATTRFHHPAHASEWTLANFEWDFDAVWALILTGITALPR